MEQVVALSEGVQAVMENQKALSAKLDMQATSLAALGVAMGMTYLASGADAPLPADVLEDRAFERFLTNYPIDGPPIVGKAVMEAHLVELDRVDPSHLAAGFRDLARQVHLATIERIRNKQIERIARERYGDLEAIEKGRTVTGEPSREVER
ncbi:hypothetical protein [Novosphingobium sp. Rr 2-17]|uniref:hypothetical protein n=1 Tax=Novosphingobium sp. Rr 2-17 TaxID=555793 RepID=UPI0005B92F08|nr:hypothetical protein [Novosphingobium sp. Rr 2-17]